MASILFYTHLSEIMIDTYMLFNKKSKTAPNIWLIFRYNEK
jgi:hypothetical protein